MKKAIIVSMGALLGSTAMAGIGANSTWSEILAARGPYRIAAPTVYMGRSIDYTFVCKEGNSLRTQRPVDIVETRGSNHRMTEVVVGQQYLSTPISYKLTQDECSSVGHRTECKPVVITGEYPMTVNIHVYKTTNKQGLESLMFTKAYTVPDCQQ